MKKFLSYVLVVMLLCSAFSFAAFADNAPKTYTDDLCKASFTMPAGWKCTSESNEDGTSFEFTNESFIVDDVDFVYFMYQSNVVELSELKGYGLVDSSGQVDMNRVQDEDLDNLMEEFLDDAGLLDKIQDWTASAERIGGRLYYIVKGEYIEDVVIGDLIMSIHFSDTAFYLFVMMDLSRTLDSTVSFSAENEMRTILRSVRYTESAAVPEVTKQSESTTSPVVKPGLGINDPEDNSSADSDNDDVTKAASAKENDSDEENDSDSNMVMWIAIAVAVVAAVVALIALIGARKKKAASAQVPAQNPQYMNNPYAQPAQNPQYMNNPYAQPAQNLQSMNNPYAQPMQNPANAPAPQSPYANLANGQTIPLDPMQAAGQTIPLDPMQTAGQTIPLDSTQTADQTFGNNMPQ